jgi:hypothetical protein
MDKRMNEHSSRVTAEKNHYYTLTYAAAAVPGAEMKKLYEISVDFELSMTTMRHAISVSGYLFVVKHKPFADKQLLNITKLNETNQHFVSLNFRSKQDQRHNGYYPTTKQ